MAISWSDIITPYFERYLSTFDSNEDYIAKQKWVAELADLAQKDLGKDNLRNLSREELVDALNRLYSVGSIGYRLIAIFERNSPDEIKECLCQLLHVKGDIEIRLAAARRPQIGMAFMSEVLCFYRPQRWAIKNRRSLRGVARITEVYRPRDLEELSYSDFCDFLYEIEKEFRNMLLNRFDVEGFYWRYRYLLLDQLFIFWARHKK